MRFMMLVKANKGSEAGVLSSKELVAAMGKFNQEMANAGVPLSADGLVEWSSRLPFGDGEVVEVRQVFEMSAFPSDAFLCKDAACEEAWRPGPRSLCASMVKKM